MVMDTPTLVRPSPTTPHNTRIPMAMGSIATMLNRHVETIQMETIQIYSPLMAHSVRTGTGMAMETTQVDPMGTGSQMIPRNGGTRMGMAMVTIPMVLRMMFVRQCTVRRRRQKRADVPTVIKMGRPIHRMPSQMTPSKTQILTGMAMETVN